MQKRAICLVAVLALAGITRASAADDQAGTVLALAGESFVTAGSHRAALKAGDTVHVGDVVEVQDGAKVRFRMADGSILTAGAGTTVRIEAYMADGNSGRTAKLSLMSGILRALVTPMKKPSQFEVDTATGVAAVRSTDWFVEAKPKSMRVGVLKGVVSLTSHATNKSVNIRTGRGTRVEAGNDPIPPRVWKPSEFREVIDRTALP